MRKKILLSSFVLLSFTTLVSGQDSEKAQATGYTSLNFGLGIPLGDFSNEYVGSASTGGSFSVNFSTPLFKSNLGLTTKIDMGVYEMSTTPFISEQKSLMNSLGYKDKLDYTFKTIGYGSYSQTNTLIGLYATMPIKKFCIDARILGGFNFTNRPESTIYFDFISWSYNETYYEKASSSSSFAYDFGLSARYNMGKRQKLCLMVSIDFVGAYGNFYFNSKRLYYDSLGFIDDAQIQKKHVAHSVSTYNMTFGVGYVFGKANK
mgnify:CR=1 FL=1